MHIVVTISKLDWLDCYKGRGVLIELCILVSELNTKKDFKFQPLNYSTSELLTVFDTSFCWQLRQGL